MSLKAAARCFISGFRSEISGVGLDLPSFHPAYYHVPPEYASRIELLFVSCYIGS
jgi:hypothetical protein